MKSQKGITMISLILYVASFLVITTTIAGITTFFYSNIEILDGSVASNSQYNKFNLYFLNECKKQENKVLAWKESDTNKSMTKLTNAGTIVDKFITFKDSLGNKNSFIYVSGTNDLYYNSIKLCDEVDDFQIKVDETTGKTILKIFIKIDGTAFSTEYVVKS